MFPVKEKSFNLLLLATIAPYKYYFLVLMQKSCQVKDYDEGGMRAVIGGFPGTALVY